jgi:hypothetical protein
MKTTSASGRKTLLIAFAVLFVAMGVNVMAGGQWDSRHHYRRDNYGYWDHGNHYHHYTYWHNHHGYWDESGGPRIFINVD